MVAYNITANTITFFAKNRPWSISSSNPNFGSVRDALVAGPKTDFVAESDADFEDRLIGLVDPRKGVTDAADGKLEFNDRDELVYNGTVLHNVWAVKILAFKREGIPYEPVFKALEDLQTNPTPEAIERLPVFLERVQSGFLPDGRCTAFKSVRDDYKDHHTGSFDNSVGQKPREDRSVVDPNPNQTCSRGLHVGAMEYVKDFSLTHGRLMFVAFWPHDVVAVPTDYNGTKMRVCEYEVLAEVDKNFYQDFIDGRQTRVDGYGSAPAAQSNPENDREKAFKALVVGDWITTDHYEACEVIKLRFDAGAPYVVIRMEDGEPESVYLTHDEDDTFEKKVDAPPVHEQATTNGKVRIEDHPYIKDGWYNVETSENGYGQVEIGTEAGDEFYIDQKYIVEVQHKDIDLTDF